MKSYNFTKEQKEEFDRRIKLDSKSGLAKIVHEYYDKDIPLIFENAQDALEYLESHLDEDVLGRTGLGPLDEGGYNGILASISLRDFSKLGYSLSSQADINKSILDFNSKQRVGGVSPAFELFCNYTGIDIGTFVKNFSLVFWQKVAGINCSVFIDPSTDKEYSFCSGDGKMMFITKNGSILEEKLLLDNPPKNIELIRNHILELPLLYRDIQRINTEIGQVPLGVENFGMMEAQLGFDEKLYFLQWTRGITSKGNKSGFKINQLSESELSSQKICASTLIRGDTNPKNSSDWKSFQVELACPYNDSERVKIFGIYDKNDGAVYALGDRIYNEVSYPNRQIQILNTDGKRKAEDIYIEIAGDHHVKSAFTKVGIFFAGDLNKIFTRHEMDMAYSIAAVKNLPVFVNLELMSDGETAYLRRGKSFEDGSPFFVPSYEIDSKENKYVHNNLFKSLLEDNDIKAILDIPIK